MQPLSEQLRTRTRDEVLEFAYRRGDRLRRQRLVVRSAAAAVVFAAAVPVALVVLDTAEDKRQDVQVVEMPTTTTIPPDNESPAEPENGALGPVPASGAAAASQAAAPARSVVKPPVGDASKPAPSRSQVEECGTSEVSLSTSTDKPSYLPTETVVVTARIKNTSNHPCLPVTSGEVLVDDANGVRRFSDQEPVPNLPTWQAGQTIQLVFRWTPCPQQPCQFSQGAHTVRVAWHGAGNYARGTTTFTIGV